MKQFISTFLTLCFAYSVSAQSVGINTTTPDSSALLELKSTSQGMLIPRVTQIQRLAIKTPAQGLMVYQTDKDTGLFHFQGSQWKNLTSQSYNSGNIILFTIRNPSTSPDELWKANINGAGAQKVNIILPANHQLDLSDGGAMKLTPNNQRIIFQVRNTSTNQRFLYSCAIDGSNVIKLIDGPTGGSLQLGAVN